MKNYLFLNCFDIKNPKSGGAEKFTHEIAKRLVEQKNKVTFISSSYKNSSNKEILSGVKYLRFGNRLSVILFALIYYINNRKKIDFVIDQFHGYPFFTPFYVSKNKILTIIHEVADEIWDFVLPFPFNLIGKTLEKVTLKYLYKKTKFITISDSTKKDLEILKVNSEQIYVLRQGLDTLNYNVTDKKNSSQIIYTGGIRPVKRIEDQIKAINLIKKTLPEIKLIITGQNKGKYYYKILDLIKKLKLDKNIVFTGFIDQKDKYNLLTTSYITLGTSLKEGWGLAISEAAAFGIPAVCYNVNGYRDSVKDQKTGILTHKNTPENLADSLIELIKKPELYKKLQKNGIKNSEIMNWDNTFYDFMKVINEYK